MSLTHNLNIVREPDDKHLPKFCATTELSKSGFAQLPEVARMSCTNCIVQSENHV